MGKRELLIIATFVAVGVIVYHASASPRDGEESRFSLASLLEHIRREGGRRATGSVTTQGILEAPAALTELRISSIAHVTIVGEDRSDLQYALTIESSGPDEATAQATAKRTTLSRDVIGTTLAIRASAPQGVRQVASLSLRVPSRLQVRIEGASGATSIEVSDIAAIQLDAVVGDVRLSGISGAVTGTHRNGKLSVAGSGAVDLTLVASDVTLASIEKGIRVSARNGRCRVTESAAATDVDGTNLDVLIVSPAGPVHVAGTGGHVTVQNPGADVHVDVRRAPVDVTLGRAIPVTLITTDAPLRLTLDGPPQVEIDAIATDGGTVAAEDFGLSPIGDEQEMRLRHAFGEEKISVALRNRRGAIVISRTK